MISCDEGGGHRGGVTDIVIIAQNHSIFFLSTGNRNVPFPGILKCPHVAKAVEMGLFQK